VYRREGERKKERERASYVLFLRRRCVYGAGVCMVEVCVWCRCVCMVQVCVWCRCVYGAGVCMVQVCVWCRCVCGAGVCMVQVRVMQVCTRHDSLTPDMPHSYV